MKWDLVHFILKLSFSGSFSQCILCYSQKYNDNNANIFLFVDHNVDVLTVWPWEIPEQKSHWLNECCRLCYWTYEGRGGHCSKSVTSLVKNTNKQPTPDSDWPAFLAGGHMRHFKCENPLLLLGFVVAREWIRSCVHKFNSDSLKHL